MARLAEPPRSDIPVTEKIQDQAPYLKRTARGVRRRRTIRGRRCRRWGHKHKPGTLATKCLREIIFRRRLMADVPGFTLIGLSSGRRLRIPLGVLGLISRIRAHIGLLRLCGRLLFAAVFPLELLPQLALDAGMRRHDLTVRLCQSV